MPSHNNKTDTTNIFKMFTLIRS